MSGSLQRIKTLIVFTLSLLISSCDGQGNKNNAQNSMPPLITRQTPEQISQVVRMMFQDSRGVIWFGTESGTFRLAENKLIRIEGIKSESGKRTTIKDITEDKHGTIWIAHSDGISSIKGENVINYYESDGLISNDVWCITADTGGNIWIGTIQGVCTFDGKKFTKFDLPEGIKDTTLGVSGTKMVHNITQDSKGTIWFSTNAGLFSYAENILIHVSEKTGIQTNFVNEIFEDSRGKIWVSTKRGLYNLTEKKAINITEGKIETGKGTGSIAEDKEGKIWFVSNQHYLFVYDGKELKEFQKSDINKGPVVFQIFKDHQNRLWFVGAGGAYRLENEKFINITKEGPW
jgi:ligand-binding sensor domain-containing protein